MFYSHVAVQKFTLSISACGAVFCNCFNCQPRQAFNKCKSIISVSKIYPACIHCMKPLLAVFQDFHKFYANLDKDLYNMLC